jgi:soluble lytic murein transglycosylase-like protein
MPQTAAELGVSNVLDPASNLEGGTRYLRQLLDRYNGDTVKALAAYNAGPQRVDHYGGIPPYRETFDYVSRIIEDYNRKKLKEQVQPAPAPSPTPTDK